MEIRSPKDLNFNKVFLGDKVFIYPTDTCYGIGCLLSSKKGIEKIYCIKKREQGKPLSIMVKNKVMFNKYGKTNKFIQDLIDKYLPGELTLVTSKTSKIPNYFNPTVNSVGIRIPKNDFCLRILDIAGEPIITTSANISGSENIYSPKKILNQFSQYKFEERPDIFFNAGELPEVSPSTVVGIDKEGRINVLRQGRLKID